MAVVIPIGEWQLITAQYQDLKRLEVPVEGSGQATKRKPSDFAGCLSKEDGQARLHQLTQSRNEWERDS